MGSCRVGIADTEMLRNRLILFLLLVQVPVLYGDGGFLPPFDYSGSDLSEPAQRAVVVHARNREHLYLFVDYHGDADKFAWIIPCPTNPRARQTSLDVLKETARYYHRLEVHAWTEKMRGLAKSGGGVGSQTSSEHSVTVHGIQTLGPYKVATISAENENGLATWLNTNGYSVSERATPILKTYIAEKWCFAAVQIHTIPGAIQTLPPLVLDFETRYPVYPIRISALNSGTTDVRIYFYRPGRELPRRRKREGTAAYMVRDDIFTQCPTLTQELPEVDWTRMELSRVTDVLIPQIMIKLNDRFQGNSFYYQRTLAKTAGIAEALLSQNTEESAWAKQNLGYYDDLKYRKGDIPIEHRDELKRLGADLGPALRDKLQSIIDYEDVNYHSLSGAKTFLEYLNEPNSP
jgi:hypothetical protein